MRTALLVAALGLLAVGNSAQAAPIVYSFSGRISGELNGQAFTLSDYVLSLATDTDTVFQPRPISGPACTIRAWRRCPSPSTASPAPSLPSSTRSA